MNETQLKTIGQIREFLEGTAEVVFAPPENATKVRPFIIQVIKRVRYFSLSKGERGIVLAYMRRLSGYSRQHLSRLIKQYRNTRSLKTRSRANRTSFSRKYTLEDVALLVEVDRLHDTLSGPATKVLLARALTVYSDWRFVRLSQISVSHLYNLRASSAYRKHRVKRQATRPSPVPIGIRKAPAPQGVPGYIRIDTVHQGDHDGIKGVYHINAVDIVTQWQLVACVERISEAYLLPVIELLLEGFPFEIRGFHSDGGSEYINYQVARLLEKLRVEFTRSRPRHTNDNALAECKNGAVIRKMMGYSHIPQKHAAVINQFYQDVFNPYLNFHRPCHFAVDQVDPKGKIRKTYPHHQIMTPWDRFKSTANYATYLKPSVTLKELEYQAQAISDNQAAQNVQQARRRLFQTMAEQVQPAA